MALKNITTPCLKDKDGNVHYLSDPYTIGRSGKCSLSVKEDDVSREHCRFSLNNGKRWYVEDLESTNGTSVNEKKISRPVEIKPGDLIVVGKQEFVFEESETAISTTKLPQAELIASLQNHWLLLYLHENHVSQEIADAITGQSGQISYFINGLIAYWPESDYDYSAYANAAFESISNLQEDGDKVILHHGEAFHDAENGQLMGSGINFIFKSENIFRALSINNLLTAAAAEKLNKDKLHQIGEFPIFGNKKQDFYTLKS